VLIRGFVYRISSLSVDRCHGCPFVVFWSTAITDENYKWEAMTQICTQTVSLVYNSLTVPCMTVLVKKALFRDLNAQQKTEYHFWKGDRKKYQQKNKQIISIKTAFLAWLL